jgi:hypothetical protein
VVILLNRLSQLTYPVQGDYALVVDNTIKANVSCLKS